MACAVCFNLTSANLNRTLQDNAKVACSKCNTKVHPYCYGKLTVGTERCHKCSYPTKVRNCVLCGRDDNVLKKCSYDRKPCGIHVICALFTDNIAVGVGAKRNFYNIKVDTKIVAQNKKYMFIL